jgi:N-acetylglutamate synthase
MLTRRLEEAALNAWPAVQQMLYDGWVLRCAEGYTKRANSVTSLYPSHLDVWHKITFCERWYHRRGLKPIFRLTPLTCPSELDRLLEERGYIVRDPTMVMTLPLKDWRGPVSEASLYEERLQPWLMLYARFSGARTEGGDWVLHHTHEQILSRIPGMRLLASMTDGGHAVACGLGVLQDDLFGLFDVVVDPLRRSRGHGTHLVSAMVNWAIVRKAGLAYLQVTQANTPARRLYERLGFRDRYRYWYRVLP